MPRVTKAVFFDALGTTVGFKPPWPRLVELLDGQVSLERAESAFRAEMEWYVAHSHEGTDDVSLADLRRRAAEVLSRDLGVEVSVETMLDSIRFFAFPDAAPALDELRRRGLRTVAVSNWDCALDGVLEDTGLGGRFDAVVTSASVGARKPDQAVFDAALAASGCARDEVVHVGDSPGEDIEGARGAGIRALLIDREGGGDLGSLDELAGLL